MVRLCFAQYLIMMPFDLNFFYVGAKYDGNRLVYLLQYKDSWPNRVISSDEASNQYPKILVNFLESHIYMTSSAQNRVNFPLVEVDKTIGEPIRIKCKYI